MRDRTRNLLLPVAMLAALAACGEKEDAPAESREFDWAAIVADGDWAAGHAGFYRAAPPAGEMIEIRLVDQRALGGVCENIFDPLQIPQEFTYMRLRLPNLEAGTHRIVPTGEELAPAGLRLIRVWEGFPVPELEAVDGTVTITPGDSPEHVTIAIDASFATGKQLGADSTNDVTFRCQDGENRENFECHSPGCCYGEKRVPFAVTLDSSFCPEFCDAITSELRETYCAEGH